MLSVETWIIFLTAALALAFAPGPGMLYVLSRAISGGRPAGIASTLGAAVGGIIHVFGAALGISAILATSAVAFMIMKYLGAIFLIYLGVKMIYAAYVAGKQEHVVRVNENATCTKSAFYQGIVSEFLNPKTAIFFLAFIPQFVQPETGRVFGQFMILGIIVVLLNSIPDFLISFFSTPVERLWKSNTRFRLGQQYVSGTCLVGLGVYLAVSGNHKSPS